MIAPLPALAKAAGFVVAEGDTVNTTLAAAAPVSYTHLRAHETV